MRKLTRDEKVRAAMSTPHRLQLLGIKPVVEIRSLLELGWMETSEWLECPLCSQRYQVLIDTPGADPSQVNVLDVNESIRALAKQISSEHDAGHESDLVAVELVSRDPAPQRMASLNLQEGDRITASWAAMVLRDCRCCCRCDERSYRVVEIESGARTHRYVALCEDHFTDACLVTPDLAEFEFAAAMLSSKL